MNRISLKLPFILRLLLYLSLAVSWFTGLGFFLLDTFFQIEGEFGPQKHPWQNPALTLHGGAAFIMMIWFGAMLSAHVPMGWRTKRIRFWGITLVSCVALQIFTAYLLYYVGHELTRETVKWIHLAVGLSLPLILTSHIRAGRKRGATS